MKAQRFRLWLGGLLLGLALGCSADVFNHSSATLFLLGEEGDKVFELPPGGAFLGRQDAILLPSGAGVRVFKTVDQIDVVISPRHTLITYGGTLLQRCGQWLIGGWLDRRPVGQRWVQQIGRHYRESFG